MHAFDQLIQYCTAFSLAALSDAQQRLVDAAATSSATPLVKAFQMAQLQRIISAVGMFSIFDAELQAQMEAMEGFQAAENTLSGMGECTLAAEFRDFKLAINVLKHGRGRSYDQLVTRAGELPFRIKLPDEFLFNDGDVSEVRTLIDVDDDFVQRCADIISAVSRALQRRAVQGSHIPTRDGLHNSPHSASAVEMTRQIPNS